MFSVLLTLAGCAREEPAAVAPAVTADGADRPDIVLYLVSGLRADPANQPLAEAAFFGAMGVHGTRFSGAYAQSSGTYQSFAALLTGRYPTSIPLCGLYMDGVSGVETRLVQANAEVDRAWCADLPASVPTLPEVLGLYGYTSALYTAGVPGAKRLGRGFGTVEEIDFDTADGTDWTSLTTKAGGWWDAHADAPRLLVVLAGDTQVAARPPVLDRMGVRLLHEGLIANPQKTDADPAEVAKVYEEVATATGQGLAGVRTRLGEGERVEVVASLHGVSLVESAGFWSMPVPVATTSYVLDRVVHVPLAILGEDGTRSDLVELVDVLPTLTAKAGAVAPASIPGSDLLGPAAPEPTAWSEFGDTLMLRKGKYALLFRAFLHHGTILDPQIDERLADGQMTLFSLHDVVADPWQEQNLVQSDPGRFQQMRAEMLRFRKGAAAPPADTWSDPQRLWEIRMARSHGYW